MNKNKLEQWLNSIDSRHRAVLVVAKRAKQLQKGLRPFFESKSSKVTTLALEEFINNRVGWYELTDDEIDALRKKMEAARAAEEQALEKEIQKAKPELLVVEPPEPEEE
ncbi:MAG TPA: DNA-directed RNA polymerase subunit omega [bacterium]|nr:DNA-directed RNA polymerase subunit omega [bacterium]